VIGEEGWEIGEVKDVVVDMGGWQVKALDVQLFPNVAEEFGMKKLLRGTRVPIGIEHVKGVGDAVILKVSKAQLKSMLQPQGSGEKVAAPAS
jgi:sporulation protein YlmC with PRC-barrel domain